ncbi:MAG TPA: GNAT family N-acetyltransferase [Methylophaga aminisulfidivorans]|nr:GNAT family N-acetyltransferase [Methylophaga aminisulfidivorans]
MTLMKINEIPSQDTLQLRNDILRPGKARSECVFEGDNAQKTRHFGAFDDAANIEGIVSVYCNQNPLISHEVAYQIRAMATSRQSRGQGIGRLLLSAAEEYAKTAGASVVWANARQSAIGFYKKAGYDVISEEFVIDGIGPHYLVSKSLTL